MSNMPPSVLLEQTIATLPSAAQPSPGKASTRHLTDSLSHIYSRGSIRLLSFASYRPRYPPAPCLCITFFLVVSDIMTQLGVTVKRTL